MIRFAGKSDPYAKVYVNSRVKHVSRVIDDDLTPDWNECVAIDLPVTDEGDLAPVKLRFEVRGSLYPIIDRVMTCYVWIAGLF